MGPRPAGSLPVSGRWHLIRRGTDASIPAILALLLALITTTPVAVAASPGVMWHGPRRVRTIALTIDDGWSPARCRRMYDTLVATGVPATWFPNAVYVRHAPALWKRIAERFPIGNHTYFHLDLTRLTDGRMRREIWRDERVIESITGRRMTKILRPPFGAFDQRVRRVAHGLGYDTLALWEASDADSSPRTTVRSGLRAASRGRPGSIVLLHCGPAITPLILPGLIRHYACAGYRFVTLEGMLARAPGVRARVDCGGAPGRGRPRPDPIPRPGPPAWPRPAPSTSPASPEVPDTARLLRTLIEDLEAVVRRILDR